MRVYQIRGNKITDWKSFHAECKFQLSFPDYYGENMDAWIDCVDELSSEPTLIEIKKGNLIKEQAPEIMQAIFECSAFVNFRKTDVGNQPTLMISMK